MVDLCDCCSPGQQWLELQSDRPRAIDHGNTASVIKRRTKQADITFSMLYCPLENINARASAWFASKATGKRTKERMEMMVLRLAKLLVKTVRFTVSISTFSLRRSMGSFSTTSIPRRSVQFSPLRLPFIEAALQDAAWRSRWGLPSPGSPSPHCNLMRQKPRRMGGRKKIIIIWLTSYELLGATSASSAGTFRGPFPTSFTTAGS